MSFHDQNIAVEILGKFFNKNSTKIGNKLVSIVMKHPWWTLEMGAQTGSAALSRTLKAALSSMSDVQNFHQNGETLYLGKIRKVKNLSVDIYKNCSSFECMFRYMEFHIPVIYKTDFLEMRMSAWN